MALKSGSQIQASTGTIESEVSRCSWKGWEPFTEKKDVERDSQIDPTDRASVGEQALLLADLAGEGVVFMIHKVRGADLWQLLRDLGVLVGVAVTKEVAEKHSTPLSLLLFGRHRKYEIVHHKQV